MSYNHLLTLLVAFGWLTATKLLPQATSRPLPLVDLLLLVELPMSYNHSLTQHPRPYTKLLPQPTSRPLPVYLLLLVELPMSYDTSPTKHLATALVRRPPIFRYPTKCLTYYDCRATGSYRGACAQKVLPNQRFEPSPPASESPTLRPEPPRPCWHSTRAAFQ